MNTRKYPRTLEQAFGPYCGREISEPDRPFDWQDSTVLVASALCALGLVIFAVVGWL